MPEYPNQPLFTKPQSPVVSGDTFLLPVCLNSAQLNTLISLYYLGMWQVDESTNRQLDYSGIWPVLEAMAFIDAPELADCGGEINCEEACAEFPANAGWIDYAPNDPFQTPNHVPDGYIFPPWYNNPTIPLPGVLPGDAMVNLTSIPIFGELPAAFNWPRAEIKVTGTGEVEVELVKVPQGGYAAITTDNDLLTAQFVDLNSLDIGAIQTILDILGIVVSASQFNTETIEIDFTTPGDHSIYIQFLPKIFDGTLLGMGGGIRRVSLCGFVEEGEITVPEWRTTNDGCTLEMRPNPSADWVVISANICGEDGEPGEPGADGADAPGVAASLTGTTLGRPYYDRETRCRVVAFIRDAYFKALVNMADAGIAAAGAVTQVHFASLGAYMARPANFYQIGTLVGSINNTGLNNLKNWIELSAITGSTMLIDRAIFDRMPADLNLRGETLIGEIGNEIYDIAIAEGLAVTVAELMSFTWGAWEDHQLMNLVNAGLMAHQGGNCGNLSGLAWVRHTDFAVSDGDPPNTVNGGSHDTGVGMKQANSSTPLIIGLNYPTDRACISVFVPLGDTADVQISDTFSDTLLVSETLDPGFHIVEWLPVAGDLITLAEQGVFFRVEFTDVAQSYVRRVAYRLYADVVPLGFDGEEGCEVNLGEQWGRFFNFTTSSQSSEFDTQDAVWVSGEGLRPDGINPVTIPVERAVSHVEVTFGMSVGDSVFAEIVSAATDETLADLSYTKVVSEDEPQLEWTAASENQVELIGVYVIVNFVDNDENGTLNHIVNLCMLGYGAEPTSGEIGFCD